MHPEDFIAEAAETIALQPVPMLVELLDPELAELELPEESELEESLVYVEPQSP